MPDGRKKWKTWINTRENYKLVKRKENLDGTNRGLYGNNEEWLDNFLDGKGAFYNGIESADSDNDDETYNENNDQQLPEVLCISLSGAIPSSGSHCFYWFCDIQRSTNRN